MTRAKYNKNPKLTREQWVGFYKQQNMQVSLLLCALEEAHKKIEILEGQLAQKIIEEEVVVVEEEEDHDDDDDDEEEEEEEEDGIEEASSRKTILVMDSHVKNLNTRQIEEELGGLLFTGQFSCERRAYNSGPWPSAKFPNQNLKTVLPKLLKERAYTAAILQASCNDVSNLSHLISKDKKLLFHMAEKSSMVSIKNLIFVSHCCRKY